MRIGELTNLYVAAKAKLEQQKPAKRQKAVEGIPLGEELVRDAAIISFMLAVIFLLISIVPPPLHEGFDVTNPPKFVKPDWYLLWSLGPIFLAKWPVPNPGIPGLPDPLIDQAFMGTILVNVAFVALIVVPFIGKGKAMRPVESPLNFSMGILGLAVIWWLSIVGIADILFAYEIKPKSGALHWLLEGGITPDPSKLIDWLGLITIHQCVLVTVLAYWFMKRHRPRYESKLNATYYKVR